VNKLKKFRVESHFTQYEFADLAKIPRHRLQAAESGIAVLSNADVKRISVILGMKQIPGFLEVLVEPEFEYDSN
jgi:transcriptional regulator with XRE-family HTH domain